MLTLKLCHYLVLDLFSFNSIRREGEKSGYRKNREGKSPECHRPGGKRPGEHVQGKNVLHPDWCTVDTATG